MLALIAGRGRLPAAVASAATSSVLVCAVEGFTPDGLTPDLTFRLETLGTFLLHLGERGVTDVCFCGSIDRPQIDPSKLDAETAPLVPILSKALQLGDDGALKVVISLFEQTGFTLRGAHEIAPSLLPAIGVPTKTQPHDGHRGDIPVAMNVLADQGQNDLGQACVVHRGKVIVREDDRGTDAMLGDIAQPFERAAPMDPLEWAFDEAGHIVSRAIDWMQSDTVDAHKAPGAGAILFKGPKPGQDMRADMPTIGPATAMRAAEAGMDGIVIQSGGVIVLDQPQVLEILNAMNMFLWVREATS